MEKYQKEYEISSYECNRFGQLRLRSLFNLFQDVADIHADIMGVGFHFCEPRQIGWIGGYYHLRIYKLPSWTQKVILSTWPSKSTGVTGIREFKLTDEKGEILIGATSQWVLVDTLKHRPISVQKNIGNYDLIEERCIESSFEKILNLTDVSMSCSQIIREDDIDINQHVNNAVYPCWVLDSVPYELLKTYDIKELQIQFKQSAQKGDVIVVKTSINQNESVHCIENPNTSVEFARVKIIWQKK